MVIFNLECSVMDKLGRATATKHIGMFKTEEEVEKAKVKTQTLNKKGRLAFTVYFIDKYF